MHDIRFIRDNPEAFDRALARRGLPPRGAAADRARRDARRRRDPRLGRDRAGAPQRGVQGDRRGEEKQGRGQGQGIADRGRRAERQSIREADGRHEREERSAPRNWTRRWRKFPICRSTMCPTARTPSDNVEHHRFGAKRDYALRAEAAFRARRSARPDGFRDRGEAFRRAFCGLEERTCAARTRARTVHARRAYERARLHRSRAAACWCATRRCSARRNCRSFSDDQFHASKRNEVQRKHAYETFEQDRNAILEYVDEGRH